ncbi:MAG: PaaI family thioesterase [Nitrospirota bacterium]
MNGERENNPHCFVCGEENPCGLHLSFRTEGGKATAEFAPSPTHQGYRNLTHGGIIAAVLDEAMIQAALGAGIAPMTAEITVRFRKPFPTDTQRAIVEAELTRNSARLVEAVARLLDARDGSLIAEAQAKLVL